MNGFDRFPAATNGNMRPHRRQSGEFRNGSNGGPNGHGTGNGNGHAMGGRNSRESNFDGPRSPPNNKNTQHVPCKFFRQGACQAGTACPFSHTLETVVETPCKYFQKGNCKFGLKCALAHFTPDGRRVPSGNFKGSMAYGRAAYYPHHDSHAPSLLSLQQAHLSQQMPPMYGQAIPDEVLYTQGLASPTRNGFDVNQLPTIDAPYTSHPGSNYGSPPNDRATRSPVPVRAQNGLSVMDVPLPASFDSNGVSEIARYGPIAASLPGRIMGSSPPPAAIPIGAKTGKGSAALASLHSSAFGDDRLNNMDKVIASSPPMSLGRSPPTQEEVGRRMLHSSRLRPKMIPISQSLDARPRMHMGFADMDREEFEDDSNYPFEEELVPDNLSHLLTPQEKMRRYSRTADDNDGPFSSSYRQAQESTSKVGSPSASSPSKFSSLFAQRYASNPVEPTNNANPLNHVGSPLRSSPLNPGSSPSLKAISRPTSGELGSFVSSPPRQGTIGMSLLSEHLRRTRLSTRTSSDEMQSPAYTGMTRTVSNSSNPGAPKSALGRTVSSGSAGRSDRILEGQEDDLFQLDDVGSDKESRDRKKDMLSQMPNQKENSLTSQTSTIKNTNGVWGFGIIGRPNGAGGAK